MTVEKDHHRDLSEPRLVVNERRVAILVRHKEIALPIVKELRFLDLAEQQPEMPLQSRLLLRQQGTHSLFSGLRNIGAHGLSDLRPCHLLVGTPQQAGRTAQGRPNFRAQCATRRSVKYVRNLDIVDHMSSRRAAKPP
ncbi:hypothetical protein [Mesorhizobium sp. M0589]|uniref:hypothetical protein n=1 Tax=Mesorhizobium sp. M0589 TaxID=2956965 RepID=UPI0033356F50